MQETEEHTQEQEQSMPQQTKESRGPKKRKWLPRLLGGEVLQSRLVLKQLPLILLICVYAIVLVYNRYKVETLTAEKQEVQQRINCLREACIDLQKRYQETVKISQIAEMLDSTGVGITAGHPYELIVD